MHVGVSGRTFTVEEPGGAVRVGMTHAKRLPTNVDRTTVFGHDSLREAAQEYTVESTGFYAQSLPFGILWEQALFPTLAARSGVDIGFFPNTLCPLRPTEFPVIVMIHGVPEYRGFGSDRYVAFRKRLLPRVASRADHIVTVSEFSKRQIATHLPVSSADISVVYNGIGDRFLGDATGDATLQLPEPYLLYVGAQSERKNFAGVLRAFERFKQTHDTDHSLVVVGPSQNATYDVLDPEEFSPSTADAICQPGYVSDEELRYAYENAALFLFPSRYEGFGLPPLEAAAVGTPVVSSRVGAIPEILGETAEYVDPDDPYDIADGVWRMLQRTDDEQVRATAEALGEYTWARASTRLTEVLRDVFEGAS
ncbi:glycosyltransferase family 4 protein [Halorientalis regularis]|uniref:Glycosyltransferase involved in cell wall bisynthesis n=1 Tax=Halorientalis regularis TaxID=660518 RepID=A0A1G7T4J6_9EURY|nr:glycosyltransferase family 1 protein [Halorientalis regularis]SDG29569.1 Glycosyltransferase involved in cell wall bisynthesis [Halorientalis regularis]